MLWQLSLLPDGSVHLSFLDIGQGDSALIVSPTGKQIVIDTGPDLSTLQRLGERMPFFDRSIDLLILSHPNLDHIAATPEILKRYAVSAVLIAGTPYQLGVYERSLSLMREKGIPVIEAHSAKSIDLGDGLAIDVLWPPEGSWGKEWKNENNASVVARVRYGENTALFTGDIESDAESALLQTGYDLASDVLKVAHHGSRTSTSTGFLLAVRPSLAVISVGARNRFGHPRSEVLSRLTHYGIPYKRTDRDGTVEVVWK